MKSVIWNMGLLLIGLLTAVQAAAQWELDGERSSINFISMKNAAIAETHSFTSLVGYIGKTGNVQLNINLNSVETQVPIRNERMQKLLFETAEFPNAKISANVDPAVLAAVVEGGTVSTEIPVTLSLHGLEQELAVAVTVFSDGGSLRVISSRPLLLRAADFGLLDGIEALR